MQAPDCIVYRFLTKHPFSNVKKEVLRSYFEKTCSREEAAAVELWLLDPANKAAFDQFLETYWDEHVQAQEKPVMKELKQRSTIRRFLPRVAAAAAVIGVIVLTAVYVNSGESTTEESNALAGVTQEKIAPLVADTAELLMKSDVVKEIKREAMPTEKHSKANASKQAPAVKAMVTTIGFGNKIDSSAMAQHSVKPARMNRIMINDSLLSRLGETERMAVLHQMALRVDFNNASFNDIAAVFRDKYGIVLELCASNGVKDAKAHAYTAQFSNVTFPELMNDMSKQMMFTYTMVDNVVKVCFN